MSRNLVNMFEHSYQKCDMYGNCAVVGDTYTDYSESRGVTNHSNSQYTRDRLD